MMNDGYVELDSNPLLNICLTFQKSREYPKGKEVLSHRRN